MRHDTETEFADQLKAQSEIWRAQTKDYQERLEQAGEQARAEYKKAMEQMEAKSKKRSKARRAGPERQRGGLEGHGHRKPEGFAELQRGWAEAVSRFPVIDAERSNHDKAADVRVEVDRLGRDPGLILLRRGGAPNGTWT